MERVSSMPCTETKTIFTTSDSSSTVTLTTSLTSTEAKTSWYVLFSIAEESGVSCLDLIQRLGVEDGGRCDVL